MKDGRESGAGQAGRKPYAKPKLTRYGTVKALTRSGLFSRNEGAPTQKKTVGSDRGLKQRIERVGTHPRGYGLYLFDYRPEFRDEHGHGRQFGVMADEVEALVPEAVSRDARGYLAVDYAVLGIDR